MNCFQKYLYPEAYLFFSPPKTGGYIVESCGCLRMNVQTSGEISYDIR